MINQDWSKLFLKSSFFGIHKTEDLSADLKSEQSKILYDKSFDNFHPNRKEEFLLGRLCASKAHELCTGKKLLELKAYEDRAPAWPSDVVGSISHNQYWVGSAVAKKSELLGVGIDFEVMGRTKIELARQIKNGKDLTTHPDFSAEELLTLIFSCKESLYKALYPSVKKFFGFEAAAVREVNLDQQTFMIELITQLSSDFSPNKRATFEGRFAIDQNSCLTVIEIPHT
jgi:enterobactin synthetase component D